MTMATTPVDAWARFRRQGRTEGELETGLGWFASGLRVAAKEGTDFGFLNIQIQPQNPKIGSSILEPRWVFLTS